MGLTLHRHSVLIGTMLTLTVSCTTPESGGLDPGREKPGERASSKNHDVPTTHELGVRTNVPWQGTRIEVHSGQRIAFTASGEYIFHSAGYACGPEGIPDANPFTGSWPANELTGLALVGKIGETGTPFLVGPGTEIQADHDGEVFLGVNDDIVDENTGTLSVKVEIHPPAGRDSKD